MIIPPIKDGTEFKTFKHLGHYVHARIITIDSAANWDDPMEAAIAHALKAELEAIAERV